MIIMLINNTDSPKYSISVRLGSSYSIFLKRDMTIIIPHMIDRTVITKNTIGFPFWYVNNFKDSSLENLLNNSLFKFHKNNRNTKFIIEYKLSIQKFSKNF